MYVAPKPDYYHTLHDGFICTLQRSPFFKDIILVIGGWTFSLWKEGIQVRLINITYLLFNVVG
jgi:hypothetical protein